MTQLSTLISTIIEVESAQRGFIFTGNETFLEPLDQADLKIINIFHGLKQLTSDNPYHQRRINTIRLLIDKRLGMIKFLVSIRRFQGFDMVQKEIEKGQGRQLQDEIRRNVEYMQSEERIIQVKLEQSSNHNIRITKLVLIFGSLTAFLFFFLALIIIRRGLVKRRLVELEIKMKNEELQRLSSEKDKFFSIIAHDLRSPFYGFLGLTELLVEELPVMSFNESKRIAVNLNDSAVATFRLLENLLEWSRMEQGLIPFKQEIFQLLPVIDECLSAIWELAKNKGIEIKSDISSELYVYADRNMLQTVIRNLVSNALKFTDNDGEILISAKSALVNNIEISIKDSGIGMKQEIIENLFKLHVNTSRPGTKGEPSTGLGLLLCKEFVEKNGGKIWVESEENIGSEFHFTIPCKV
jgi:signal transduction histidine kinase